MSRIRPIGAGLVVLLSAGSLPGGLAGCVATAVVATVVVVRMLTPYGYKLTIKAEQDPRTLYNGLVSLLKRSHADIKILVENQPERAFDATWTAENGDEEWVSLVVQPLPDETSELIIAIGFSKKQKAEYKEWATERVGEMMAELNVEWKVAAASDSEGTPFRFADAPPDPLAAPPANELRTITLQLPPHSSALAR